MMDLILGFYIKINLLLALTYLFWCGTKFLSRLFNLEIQPGRQLLIVRQLFLGVVILLPFFIMFNVAIPGLREVLASARTSMWVGELSVSPLIDQGIQQQFFLADWQVSINVILAAVLIGGILLAGGRLYSRFLQLRAILNSATEIRLLSGVHVLFSDLVSSPFSTLALGKKQVVLPSVLLNSPEYMQLAVKHELQHFRNGDLHWVLFLEALEVFCFWNPAIYAWHNEFDCLQEYACDEAVVSKQSVNTNSYGHCLLEVAAYSSQERLFATSNMVPRFSWLINTQSQLKRRVMMFTSAKNNRLSGIKLLIHSVVGGTGFAVLSLVLFTNSSIAQDRLSTSPPQRLANSPSIIPIETKVPTYPAAAVERKLEGWILTEFVVDETGAVIEAEVVDGCAHVVDSSCLAPDDDMFHASALAAIGQFKFEPRMENGNPVQVSGVRYLFRYSLDND